MRPKFNEARTFNRSLGFRIAIYGVVRERSVCFEAQPEGLGGAIRSENAGMSSEIEVRIFNSE